MSGGCVTNRENIFSIIGKKVTGIYVGGLSESQTEAYCIRLTFDDGSELRVDEKYIEGWCGFNISASQLKGTK